MSTLAVDLPQTPSIPNISPSSPSIPSLPTSLPSVPSLSSLPQVPSLPSLGSATSLLGGGNPLSSAGSLIGSNLTTSLPSNLETALPLTPSIPELDPSTITDAATQAGLDALNNIPGVSQAAQVSSLIKKIMDIIVGAGKGETSLGASPFNLDNPFSFFKNIKLPDPKTIMPDNLFNADKLMASGQSAVGNIGNNLSSAAGNIGNNLQSTGQNLAGQANSVIQNIA